MAWKRTVISMGLFFVIRRKKQPRQELSMSLALSVCSQEAAKEIMESGVTLEEYLEESY